MRRLRLFFLLLLMFVGAVLLSVAASAWYASRAIERVVLDEQYADLESAAHLALLRFGDLLPGDQEALSEICREMGRQSMLRISVVFTSGEVACDSEVDRNRIESPEGRPEYKAAFAGKVGHAVSMSRAVGRSYLYVAVPLRQGGGVVGALRVGSPFLSTAERIHLVRLQLLVASGVIVLFGSALCYLLARRIARPIEELRAGVKRFAGGDLRAPLTVPLTPEFADLARGLNAMAGQLEARLAASEEQRNMQESILSGMVEGVLAVDLAGRVLLINSAGAALLRREPATLIGSSLGDTPVGASLLGFVARALAAPGTLVDEIFSGAWAGGGLHLHVRSAPLHHRIGTRFGALIMVHDVSHLERLEQSHRDFAANISHELKTPLTTITGYTELLLDGAGTEPAMVTRFLETIRRQAERLQLIIDDLVVLARLDQEGGRDGIAGEPVSLGDILADAVDAVRGAAELACVRVDLECPEMLAVGANPLLLSQAVTNLVQNALAHSEPGGRILVQATAAEGTVAIAVRDWGAGIAPEHLSRIFERFYRVDSGRSRQRGGSGLGLAIVQHIAIVHGGTVTVESAPGQGSTFTIRIPAPG
ncbi:MAG: sensor histidine kinase [Candidatus Methylomirabilia bacterium]